MQSAKLFYLKKTPLVFVIFLALILTFSCAKKDPYLYDKTGFDPGEQPQNSRQSAVSEAPARRVAPDYYYRQSTYPNYQYPPQTHQQPYAPMPQYQQPAPYYYQPYPPQTYPPQVIPGSRFYSNPYAIPPSSRYPNYDADQYYVPPNQYNGNSEPAQAPENSSGISNNIK